MNDEVFTMAIVLVFLIMLFFIYFILQDEISRGLKRHKCEQCTDSLLNANRQEDIWNISGRVNQESPVTRQPDVVHRPFEGVSVIATKQHEDDPPTYEEAMAISRENLRPNAPLKET